MCSICAESYKKGPRDILQVSLGVGVSATNVSLSIYNQSLNILRLGC